MTEDRRYLNNKCQARVIGQLGYDQPYEERRVCNAPAAKDSRFCKYHGGGRWKKTDPKAADHFVRIYHLPRFYSKVLKGTLQETVEEFLGTNKEEQLSLMVELALTRTVARDKVAQYAAARYQVEVLSTEPDTPEAERIKWGKVLDYAAESMRAALEDVERICVSAAKLDAMTKGLITPMGLNLFLNQLVRIVHDVCPVEVAVELERQIRENVRMPDLDSGGPRAIDHTPDLVADMDRSVP